MGIQVAIFRYLDSGIRPKEGGKKMEAEMNEFLREKNLSREKILQVRETVSNNIYTVWVYYQD